MTLKILAQKSHYKSAHLMAHIDFSAIYFYFLHFISNISVSKTQVLKKGRAWLMVVRLNKNQYSGEINMSC